MIPTGKIFTITALFSYLLDPNSTVVAYGTFYIKPNFPGRCSHVSYLSNLLSEFDIHWICNGGFIVNKDHRGKGVGKLMATSFLKIAPALGTYHARC